MFKSKRLRDVATAGLLVLFIFTAALCAQSPVNNELLKMIPAKTLFCVRVNNFDYTLNQIDQFLAGVSPIPMGVSMLVRMQLANLLGSPQLNGLNTNGSFAIFGVTSAGKPPGPKPSDMFIGALVPITDYKQFIDGNPNLSPPDANGVSKNTSSEFGRMLIKQVGNYALIGPSESGTFAATAKLISVKSAKLGSILNAADAKQAETKPIWAYGNVQQVSKAFGPIISAKIEEIKTIMKSVEGNQPGASPANIQNIMNMYAGILETLMKEIQSVSIAINPKPDVLNITKSISAVPRTEMAKMLTADATSQRENTLLTYLEDGAMANFGATMNTSFWKKLNVRSIDLFAMMSGDSMSAEDITEFKTLATNFTDCLEGPVAYSISNDVKNKPPFAVKYVIAVKDENKFNQIIEKATDIMSNSNIMDFYKSFGIETSFSMKRDVDSYKGISISSAKLTMKSTDANSPQVQMITSMYGDGFDYRWGMVDGLFACAVSGDVNSTIRELIDQVKADSPKQIGTEMKAALLLLPEANKADFVATFNALRLFNMVTSMVPIPIPPMDIQTKSNIVIASKAADNRMVVNIAVPKQHLIEIMSAFMMMQQKTAQ